MAVRSQSKFGTIERVRKGDTQAMGVTISTHNRSTVSIEHNRRNEKVVSKEPHIDKNGYYEKWHEETLKNAYERIFGGALERYNAKQKRADRQIKSYLNHIRNDETRHECYEMIVAIGNSKKETVDEKQGYEMLRQFVYGGNGMESWEERNPNLEIVGAYYHADEEGVPHVHIDYVPVAHGYKRGLDTQNGLVKAFEEMGFVKEGKETAQIQWERRENSHLESIVNQYGYEVEHPKENRQHFNTKEYKQAMLQVELEQERLEHFKSDVENTVNDYLVAQNRLKSTEGRLERLEREKNEIWGKIEAYKGNLKDLETQIHAKKVENGFLSTFEVGHIPVKNAPLQKDKVILDKETYEALYKTACLVDNIEWEYDSVLKQQAEFEESMEKIKQETEQKCEQMISDAEYKVSQMESNKEKECEVLNRKIEQAETTLKAYQKDIRKLENREKNVARKQELVDRFLGKSEYNIGRSEVSETLFKAWEYYTDYEEKGNRYSYAETDIRSDFAKKLDDAVQDIIMDNVLQRRELELNQQKMQQRRNQSFDFER